MLLSALVLTARAAQPFGGQLFYVGDLHVHTGASGDGGSLEVGECPAETCGSMFSIADTARANGLDFVAVADHVNGNSVSDQELFDSVFQLMLDAHDPEGGLVTVPAAEVYFQIDDEHRLGHKNLYLFGDNSELVDFGFDQARFAGLDADYIGSCESTWNYVSDIQSRFGPALLLPHHPAGTRPMPVDWSCSDDSWTPGVEMYSEHGNSLREEVSYDVPWSGIEPSGTIHYALSQGWRLGFYAATDTHDTMPGDVCSYVTDRLDGIPKYGGGLAVAVLDESEAFDRDTLYDAMVARRIYATSGPLVPALIEYTARGEVLGGMGEELVAPLGAALEARLSVPEDLAVFVTGAELASLDSSWPLEDRGGGVWTAEIAEAPELLYALVRLDGEAWYGAEGCDDGGDDAEERLWLSPTWFTYEEMPLDTGDTAGGGGETGGDTEPPEMDSDPPAVDSDPPAGDSEPRISDSAAPEDSGEAGGGKGCGGRPSGCVSAGGSPAGFGALPLALVLLRLLRGRGGALPRSAPGRVAPGLGRLRGGLGRLRGALGGLRRGLSRLR